MLSFIVLHSTNEVNRIEVCSLGEHTHICLVALVYLAALKNLKRYRAILVVCKERTATRLADILYDTADTHRTVEFLAKVCLQRLVVHCCCLRIAQTEVVLNELQDFLKLVVTYLALEFTEIVESLCL